MTTNKQQLQKTTLTKLKALSPDQIIEINQSFIEKMHLFLEKNPFKQIGVYLSYGVEAPTFELIEFALTKKVKVFVPKVINDQEMEFYQINSLDELVKSKKFNFFEPTGNRQKLLKKPNQIDVLFIPLTVFDRDLNRIGTGHGYYDRWITQNHFQGLKVGLARQISFSKVLIEAESHDVKLDYVITESEVYGW